MKPLSSSLRIKRPSITSSALTSPTFGLRFSRAAGRCAILRGTEWFAIDAANEIQVGVFGAGGIDLELFHHCFENDRLVLWSRAIRPKPRSPPSNSSRPHRDAAGAWRGERPWIGRSTWFVRFGVLAEIFMPFCLSLRLNAPSSTAASQSRLSTPGPGSAWSPTTCIRILSRCSIEPKCSSQSSTPIQLVPPMLVIAKLLATEIFRALDVRPGRPGRRCCGC